MSYRATAKSATRPVGLLSSGEVSRLAGCSHRTLDYWARIGLVIPSRDSCGTGTDRWYSKLDLVTARLAVMLSDHSVELRRKAISAFRANPKRILLEIEVTSVVKLFINIARIRADLDFSIAS